jgi:hypothetical protein
MSIYSAIGRPSIPPEKLLRALLLQAFYTIRSERQLMEQMDYNLLFRWFVGLSMDAPIWDVTIFPKNRERLLAGDIAAKFLAALLSQPRVKALLSDEKDAQMVATLTAGLWHCMETAAKDHGTQPRALFHGKKRSNATHASTTDPDARLTRRPVVRRPSFATWTTSPWKMQWSGCRRYADSCDRNCRARGSTGYAGPHDVVIATLAADKAVRIRAEPHCGFE